MNDGWTPRHRPDVTAVEIEGDIVILDGDGKIHVLNPTAVAVWGRCDGATSVAGIVDDLSCRYQPSAQPIGPDVTELLHRLLALGLVT